MAVGSFRVPAGGGASTEDWQRPSDWLAMPTVTDVEQKFVGLHAIFPEGNNFAALLFTTSTGQYQVDWGDGSSPTLHNSNTKAEYEYNYATYDTGNTTLSTRGYKQAIITVTPVSGNLLTANFQQRYTGQNQAYATGFLDCIISMPNNGSNAISFGGTTVIHRLLENIILIKLGNSTTLTTAFISIPNLINVEFLDITPVTLLQQCFSSCSKLMYVKILNSNNVTAMNLTFFNCISLYKVNIPHTNSLTNLEGCFDACVSLMYFNFGNTSNVTNMFYMFRGCRAIKNIPFINTNITLLTGNDISFQSFADNCNSLIRCQMVFARTVGFSSCQLSATAIEEILTNLVPRTATSATITLTGNWGLGTIVSRSFTITDGSTTITTGDTSSLVAGMQVTGTGSPLSSPVSVTFQDTGDTVTLVAHGLENDDEVSFAAITSTTGLALNTIYYIVNKTTDTFQVASTIGGSPLPLTTDGSGTMRHRTEIVSIVANTSITMSRPMRGSGSQTLAFRTLKTGTALLKNWAVTG
jgi:hypothetical protein